jgi:hypothetical protein
MTTKLPSGNTLIEEENVSTRFVLLSGLGFGIEILENDFEKGSDEWANREIEIHERIKELSIPQPL